MDDSPSNRATTTATTTTTAILSSFLRGRPRNSSIDMREPSPSRARVPAAAPPVQPQQPTTTTLTNMLRRRRSAGALPSAPAPAPASPPPTTTTATTATATTATTSATHRIRLVPHIDSRRTLRFDPIARDLVAGSPALRIGRFTDRSGLGLAAVNATGSHRLAFKSKVVSRAHAEIWVESGGRFFIKDTKSSSGTFLNHVRLSPANTESRPFQMKDGDILQLGVDYQGGTEDIYKSVKIRIELGREWQAGANAFNTNTFNVLRTLQVPSLPPTTAATLCPPTANPKSQIPDCCICLFGVTIRQALFIAPCSHTFHYKCIRPLLETHHPVFSCPLCRTFADLEEDVEVEVEVEVDAECEAECGPECEDAEPDDAHAHAHAEEMTPAPTASASVPPHVHAPPIPEVEESGEEDDMMRGVESEASASAVRPAGVESPVGGGASELGEMVVEVEVDTTVAGKRKDVAVLAS